MKIQLIKNRFDFETYELPNIIENIIFIDSLNITNSWLKWLQPV